MSAFVTTLHDLSNHGIEAAREGRPMVEQMVDDDPGVSMSFTLYMRLSRSIQVRLGARQDCDLEHESQ